MDAGEVANTLWTFSWAPYIDCSALYMYGKLDLAQCQHSNHMGTILHYSLSCIGNFLQSHVHTDLLTHSAKRLKVEDKRMKPSFYTLLFSNYLSE